MQVGPLWNITKSVVGAKQNVILSAPGPAAIYAPYNLTITGLGVLNAVYTWEWNTTNTIAESSGAQTVGRCLNPLPCQSIDTCAAHMS